LKTFRPTRLALMGLFLSAFCLTAQAENQGSSPPAQSVSKGLNQPLVVLLKSDTCAVCKQIAPLLSRLNKTYQHRSQWVTLDVSNRKTLAQAEKQVKALGIEAFFEKYGNHTGIVAVIDPKSKQILTLLVAEEKPEKYQMALDQALKILNP
jgi:hypothetical protein